MSAYLRALRAAAFFARGDRGFARVDGVVAFAFADGATACEIALQRLERGG
jgi:hypothetical protein